MLRKSSNDKYREYEERKKEIAKTAADYKEYERLVKELAEKLKI